MTTFQLFNGDCLEVMTTLPDKSVDCFICDLPYGCLTSQNINKGLMRMENGVATGARAQTDNGLLQGCAWDVKIDLEKLWVQIKRLARNDHVPILMFCTTKFGYELIKSNESWFRYDLVWDKQRGVSFLAANKMPMRSHEMVYVFSKKGAYYNRVDITGDFKKWNVKEHTIHTQTYNGQQAMVSGSIEGGDGTRCVKSVIQVSSTNKKGNHPTEKPIELYRWLLERYCPAGGTVLDPTFGSCNSGRAARALGQNYVGIEKDVGFFTKARDASLPADETVISHS
jgi:DNA modification methylase